MLLKTENYTETQQTLKQTYELDAKIADSPKHARNLLTSFVKIMEGKPLQEYLGAKAVLNDVAISPDKQKLVAVGERGTVVLFDVKTGDLLKRFTGHNDHVKAVVFDPQGKWFATAGEDKQIILWDVESGVTVQVFEDHTAVVTGLAIDGTSLFSSSADSSVKRWNLELPHQYAIILSTPATATTIAPNGNSIAIGFENGSLQGYSIEDKQPIWHQAKVHKRDIQRLAI